MQVQRIDEAKWHVYRSLENAFLKFSGFPGDTRGFLGEFSENSRVVFLCFFSRVPCFPKGLSDQSRTGKHFGNSIVDGFTPSVHWLVSRAAPQVLQENRHFSLKNNGTKKTAANPLQLAFKQNKAPASSHGSTEAQSISSSKKTIIFSSK